MVIDMKTTYKKFISLLTVLVFSTMAIGCNTTPRASTMPSFEEIVQANGGSHQITWESVSEDLGPLQQVEPPSPLPSADTTGQRQTYLAASQAAPWAGILLSAEAMAFIIAEYQASFERAAAALDAQRQLDMTRLTLEVGSLRVQMESERQQSNLIIAGLDRDIERIVQAHEQYVQAQDGGFWATEFGQILQWGLVVVGSLAVGIVVGYVAAAVR
jgi:hypothetical protein